MKYELLAIIPARGGSKGIPSKNIAKINNVPMIAYSIRAALKSSKISRVVVSTDSDKISDVSSKYGAEVIKRPTELAQDDSPMLRVIVHCLDILTSKEGYRPDAIVLLQPTSPLRTHRHIDAAFDFFEENACDAVISTCKPQHHPLKSLKIDEAGFLTGLVKTELTFAPRQTLPNVVSANGAIFLIKTDTFRKIMSLLPPRTLPYIMQEEESVDVDDAGDLKRISFLMNKYKD